MRTRTNPDGTLIVEIDIDLEEKVTFVFERKDGPLVFRGALCEYPLREGGSVRVMYAGEIPGIALSVAKERAIEACAEHDREPDTQRNRGT